ncbi:putative metal-dependent phosphoesterase TrpH [Kitasatospora sp. MAP12-15]|uniref:PHP domain-containing protein n=1 Tax=unclassified Kitasatospora TaxID=2633591 RepID=UPI0024763090|nr:PHP domain-containing protein [Kitasatospora sp. MAP12-44]MDH6112668.1 putative metal-dependent phosphoesterase TrpH [Kitasatospora sp. MAP12-44]
MRIDLHTHSNASDGTDSPAELVAAAVAAGLDVVALTDHDTVSGHAEAAAAVEALPDGSSLTLVPGAELSCRVEGISMHLLAYLFDPAEPAFARERELVRTDRFRRGQAVVERCRELGADIGWEQVRRIAGAGSVGRPHIASALVEAGVVATVSDAFTADWLANGGRADVPKHETDPAEAIRLVRAAGGVPVFAHPGAVKRGRTVSDQVIADLAAAGLGGLEVDHLDHDEETRAHLRGLAAELGLFGTGSSDYHGSRKTVALGEYTTDPAVYEQLLAQATGARPISSVRSTTRV